MSIPNEIIAWNMPKSFETYLTTLKSEINTSIKYL